MPPSSRLSSLNRTYLAVLVAALGYFVDLFDLQLFAVVRIGSLRDLGLSDDQITSAGAALLNWQMAGMLLGGILWGVLGDKKGRVYVLFGSILLYSLGNIANGLIHSVPAYAIARFVSGIGLAGEVGAGITLVSELLPKETRGYATTIVSACGFTGICTAGVMGEVLGWRMAYIGGGVLGLLLLILRISVSESGLFTAMVKKSDVPRGRFVMLFNDRKRFMRYLRCIGLAVPVYFVFGILAIFSPEICQALGTDIPVKAFIAVICYGVGSAMGGVVSGLLSQALASRKKVLAIFISITCVAGLGLLLCRGITAAGYYVISTIAAFGTGYWAMFLTTTAENFGTNLRTTAAATVPNFVRASVIADTYLLIHLKPGLGLVGAAQVVGVLCVAVAFLALWKLPETFARDLDFIEK